MRLGLTTIEAENRYKSDGPNEIRSSELESRMTQIRQALLDPMGVMLLGLACIYLFVGEKTDALFLFIAYIPVSAIDIILELRAQNAIRALKKSFKISAQIMRDGIIQEIPIYKIVKGDVIVFEEGQALPADGKILNSNSLLISEAALTGESISIDKKTDDLFYGGTTILSGSGVGEIEFIGQNTRFGKIAKLLEESDRGVGPLRKKVDQLVKKVIIISFSLAILLFFIEWYRDRSVLQSLIISLTFAMAAVPEEFPLVFTLYLSLGAWRLSRLGVLVKSLPSVETLGSVDVICTDKTGTLTEGKFQLDDIKIIDEKVSVEFIWDCALLACEIHVVDAMEMAIAEKYKKIFGNETFSKVTRLKDWAMLYDYPFEAKGKHMSHVWKNTLTNESIIAMKGSVEGVMEHCLISEEQLVKIKMTTEELASSGKRLLGLAIKKDDFNGERIHDEVGLNFIGLIVFSDPVRSQTKEAIINCQNAGIEIKMLTGDHPFTAHAVADEVGMTHQHHLLFTGDQLQKMDVNERAIAYQQGSIFSRVLPEQKHELVKVLKSCGKIVAMTGDGINDAPALKLADIGISMGKNATDVARESSQMVLLSNNFTGISEAVLEGRTIFSNLKKSFSYLISFHVPIILFSFLPPLFGWGELLLPIHIVLLELIVHPISAFVFENLKGGVKKQKSIMTASEFFESFLYGMVYSIAVLLFFYFAMKQHKIDFVRTQALVSFLLVNIVFVFREIDPMITKRFTITFLSMILLSLILTLNLKVANVFHLALFSLQDYGIPILLSIIPLVIKKIFK